MFSFENPNELLDLLTSIDSEYEELLEIAQELLPDIINPHKKITGEHYPSAITQCILECFKIKNNFKNSIWQSSKYVTPNEIKGNALLIKFSRLGPKKQVIDYEIYNLDSLISDSKDIKLKIFDTLDKALKFIDSIIDKYNKDKYAITDFSDVLQVNPQTIILRGDGYNSSLKNILHLYCQRNSNFYLSKPKTFYLNKCNSELYLIRRNNKQHNTTKTFSAIDNNIKGIIFNCVKEFNGQYGRTGIAKILKGSQSLKFNEYNNMTLKSNFFGIFNNKTLSSITSEIDELINNNMLNVKKIDFGRPILSVNPDFIDKFNDIPLNKSVKIIEEENDDENIARILYLIKNHKNVFITGHAGTGKSYILNKIKEKIPSLVITSTTGIAAVNVKGQTLHSWTGVGICNRPIEQIVEKILKKSSLKKQIQKCKILAIDEISMLDIKTFEYVDKVLKEVRDCDEPFGGIQVIFIGDFFQLPPVEKNEDVEKKYCFDSKLWNEFDLQTVLLTKNYRQNEKHLINALANMRINALNEDDICLLKTRECQESEELSNALHIFATNFEADNYNAMKFRNINSPEYKLIAIDGLYRGDNFIKNPSNEKEDNILKRIDMVCNAEKNILLKIGARVMLLINLDFEKGLINGSCGNVEEISDDYVIVNFDNGITQKIEKHDFEFYNNDVLIAKRQQFPLRLAYGITIHKSQGMSLDKLVVDCSRIFEKGQAYVALSRIKTLDGLYLHNFAPAKVMVDEKVVNFYKNLKIFDKKYIITTKNNNNSSKHDEKDLDYYTDKIRNIILENNRWIEIYEIANIIGVNRYNKLVKGEYNSTIAQIINRFLKKEGFVTKRINYDKDYSIVVAPPNFREEDIPKIIFTVPYQDRK